MSLISNINAQKGSSMIEVLISMIILLVGILGIAGLQTRGLTNSKGSYYRTQAAIFAEDLFDRMRSNRDGSTTSAYDVSDSAAIGSAASSTCTGVTSCSATALATYDLNNWAFNVKAALPRAAFTISRANSNTTLVMMWDDDKRGSSTGTNCGVDVTCMTFTSRM